MRSQRILRCARHAEIRECFHCGATRDCPGANVRKNESDEGIDEHGFKRDKSLGEIGWPFNLPRYPMQLFSYFIGRIDD